MNRKILVAYFSISGTTKAAAEMIVSAVGADIFEIKPKIPYTKEDLDWKNPQSRSSVEMKDMSSRPVVDGRCDSMDKYNVIFVGFPIWWYVAPTIVNTFLESYDFSGKTIIPFATSGGSGLGKAADILKPLCGDNVRWLPGKLLGGTVSRTDLNDWIEGLSL